MIYDLQKASILKRVSAWLLDVILTSIIAVGAMFAISGIINYDGKSEELDSYYVVYEEKYGFNFSTLTEEEYKALTEEELKLYDKAYEELINDEGFLKTYNIIINMTLVMITFGILIGILITEFVIPLILKNGQTIGKKCFNICVIMDNGVRVRSLPLLIRAVLGKFTIETMILCYFLIMLFFGSGNIIHMFIVVVIYLVNFVLLFANKKRALIHDLISYTVVVDKSSQLIFETEDDLIQYKNKADAERVANKKTF